MAFLELKNINKTYLFDGIPTQALTKINLGVEEGEFICFAGPSGSGKTTLLNILGTLDIPTSGQIYCAGKEITGLALSKLSDFRLYSVGFVFQSYNLINTLTAHENVEYILLLQGIDAKLRRQKTEEILTRVGLSAHMDKFVNRLSAGQQQRVAVARAIVSRPKVILADEPTANLDSVTAQNLVGLMRELNREEKITFLIATHDKMVMERSGKVYFMKDGAVIDSKTNEAKA